MVTTTRTNPAAQGPRPNPARRQRASAHRMRMRAVFALLVVSGVLFVAVVCWQRDRVMIKAAMDAAERVRTWTADYQKERGHLPFDLPPQVAPEFTNPEVPYPRRDDIYRLTTLDSRYVLIAGPRQGLLPPEPAGCAAVICDDGELRTAWLRMPQVEEERKHRAELLGREVE